MKSKCTLLLFYGLDAICINVKIGEAISTPWNGIIRACFCINLVKICSRQLLYALLQSLFSVF